MNTLRKEMRMVLRNEKDQSDDAQAEIILAMFGHVLANSQQSKLLTALQTISPRVHGNTSAKE